MQQRGKKARPTQRNGSEDLHGNAPDKCEVALLLIDVVNDFEYPGGVELHKAAKPAVAELLELRERAKAAGVPCVYANDNFGRWRSDFHAQIEHCIQDKTRGAELVEKLRPDPDDYFVLKPKHSAFYQTCLELLLQHLEVKTLVLGGFATDNCVSFTAHDAYLRGYDIVVASDGTAAIERAAHREALALMARVLHAQVARSREILFQRRAGRHQVALANK